MWELIVVFLAPLLLILLFDIAASPIEFLDKLRPFTRSNERLKALEEKVEAMSEQLETLTKQENRG